MAPHIILPTIATYRSSGPPSRIQLVDRVFHHPEPSHDTSYTRYSSSLVGMCLLSSHFYFFYNRVTHDVCTINVVLFPFLRLLVPPLSQKRLCSWRSRSYPPSPRPFPSSATTAPTRACPSGLRSCRPSACASTPASTEKRLCCTSAARSFTPRRCLRSTRLTGRCVAVFFFFFVSPQVFSSVI